jgi:hypothetical protein
MKPEIKYGLHITFALSLILILESLMTANLVWIELLIIAAGSYLAVRERYFHWKGFISFGDAFRPGFKAILLASPLVGVVLYSYYKFFNHPLTQKLQAEAIKALNQQIEAAKIPAEQVELQHRFIGIMVGPGGFAVGEMFLIFIKGIICCLIIALIMKKNDPDRTRPTPLDDKDWD